jgi:hypothetical protein
MLFLDPLSPRFFLFSPAEGALSAARDRSSPYVSSADRNAQLFIDLTDFQDDVNLIRLLVAFSLELGPDC